MVYVVFFLVSFASLLLRLMLLGRSYSVSDRFSSSSNLCVGIEFYKWHHTIWIIQTHFGPLNIEPMSPCSGQKKNTCARLDKFSRTNKKFEWNRTASTNEYIKIFRWKYHSVIVSFKLNFDELLMPLSILWIVFSSFRLSSMIHGSFIPWMIRPMMLLSQSWRDMTFDCTPFFP